MKLKLLCIIPFIILFSINGLTQTSAQIDSIVKTFEAALEPIEVIHHPIQKHFLNSQNKFVVNQSSRELAATFDDPSRVLYRHAGISISNDQSNAIVYRGIPSEFTNWSINGAEIVNPNHLSNAGRISDQSSPSAGGVLAIPFEVINKFSFYGNAYSPQQVNSLSGVSDFNFDTEGDNFFKVGLLGMEAGFQTKGNLEKGQQNIKGNFRYSTVGLLSDLGVNFDGESIKFYDGFIKADVSEKVSIVALGGISTNFKESVTVQNATEIKDLQEIDFQSRFFVIGATYNSKNQKHSLFLSSKKDERSSFVDLDLAVSFNVPIQFHQLREVGKIAYNGRREFDFLNQKLTTGIQFLLSGQKNRYGSWLTQNDLSPILKPFAEFQYLQEFGSWNVKLEPGMAVRLAGDKSINAEPSLFVQVGRGNFVFDLNYSRKSQLPIYDIFRDSNQSPDVVEAMSAAVKVLFDEHGFSAMARVYNLNVSTLDYVTYSILNGLIRSESDMNSHQSFKDNINSKGFEFMIDKSWTNGWYTHANFTLFDARYDDFDINTNDNFKSIYNLAVTKEIKTKRNNKWIFNLAFHQRGGVYQNEYDFVERIFEERRLSKYYRIDARLQYTWKSKNMLTLDIQNLTNRQNDAYFFYDAFKREEVLQKQLGTIPILSYKRTF